MKDRRDAPVGKPRSLGNLHDRIAASHAPTFQQVQIDSHGRGIHQAAGGCQLLFRKIGRYFEWLNDRAFSGYCERLLSLIAVTASRRAFAVAEAHSNARFTASAVCPCLESATVAPNQAGSNSRRPTASPAFGACSTRQAGRFGSSSRTGATWRLAQLPNARNNGTRSIPDLASCIGNL